MTLLAKLDKTLAMFQLLFNKILHSTGAFIENICEGDTTTIGCGPQGGKMHIIYAFYGRSDRQTCSQRHNSNTNCFADRTQIVITE